MKQQTSLGATVLAPVERQFTWIARTGTVSTAGQYVKSDGASNTVYAVALPKRSVTVGRHGFGQFEVGDAQMFIRGEVQPGGQVLYPGIKEGDILVDPEARRWEVLSTEEWITVGLLVLNVRQVTRAA